MHEPHQGTDLGTRHRQPEIMDALDLPPARLVHDVSEVDAYLK